MGKYIYLVYGIVAVAVFYLLYKAGIFKLTNTAADVVGSAGKLASNVLDTIDTGLSDLTSGQIGADIGTAVYGTGVTQESIWSTVINGGTVSSLAKRTMTMMREVYRLFPSEATATTWGIVAGKHLCKFDSNGYITSYDAKTVSTTVTGTTSGAVSSYTFPVCVIGHYTTDEAKGTVKVTQRVLNMRAAALYLFPTEATMSNWGVVAAKHGCVFDSNGYVTYCV